MNVAEVMLLACFVLGVFYLIIIALSEPRYTWRDIATFDEKIAEMNQAFEAFGRAIGDKLIPVFSRAIQSLEEFSATMKDYEL